MPAELPDQEGDTQDNFVEARDPIELAMMLIFSAAYLGLAQYVSRPLLLVSDMKLLLNVECFFVIIAAVAFLIGVRPYMSPSSLQLSARGIKYRGAYWPQRKTVNWDQVYRIYLSPELIIVLYRPNPNTKRIWPMLIASIYLADRERIPACILRHCPIQPVIMTSPTIRSRIVMGVMIVILAIWLFELLKG